MRRQLILGLVSTAAIFVLAVVAAVVLRSPTSRSATVCPTPAANVACTSGALPGFDLPTLAGGRVSTAALRGRVLVVNFWNYDCPPCRQEEPLLEQAWRTLQGQGVEMVGVMYVGGQWPHSPGAARAFLRKMNVTYPVGIDATSSLANGFGIAGIPTTYVADASGRLRYEVTGALNPGELQRLVQLVKS